MSILQGFPTQQWAIFAKSLRDDQMASISNRNSLAKATSLRDANLGPICLPFERLGGGVSEFTA